MGAFVNGEEGTETMTGAMLKYDKYLVNFKDA